jgi:hypothetical protein
LILAGPAQRIEHPLNTVVVAIDEGIVEDDRRGHSPFRPPTLSWRGRTSASRLDTARRPTPWLGISDSNFDVQSENSSL